MGWYVGNEEAARAAALDLETTEIIYALQVADLIEAYNNMRDQESESLDLDNDPWDHLSPELKQRYIIQATKFVDNLMSSGFSWYEAFQDAISDVDAEIAKENNA